MHDAASLGGALAAAEHGLINPVLMKGSLHTDELLSALVNPEPETALRTDQLMSHDFIFDVPDYPRQLLVSNAAEITDLLYHRSCLLGMSGISGDMQALLDSEAPEAIDLFVYRTGRALGSLAAALGGLDTLVFTAGIGQNADVIRQRMGNGAAWLG